MIAAVFIGMVGSDGLAANGDRAGPAIARALRYSVVKGLKIGS